jgi:hypothetical protein
MVFRYQRPKALSLVFGMVLNPPKGYLQVEPTLVIEETNT